MLYKKQHKIPVFLPLARGLQGGRVLAWLLEELGWMKALCAGMPSRMAQAPLERGMLPIKNKYIEAYNSRTSLLGHAHHRPVESLRG